MGVQGLLQLLKPVQRDCQISQFRGQTAAIDIMTWLYKGAYSCAYELGLDQQTLNFLAYPIKMIKLVQQYGIKPICVFDGLHLKAKEATEKMRSSNKKANKEMAMQNAENGNEDEARKYFMRSLILRSKMIDLFIDILRCLDIPFIIAPYEADAQIAYMVREKIADFAISEDSDLIAYGCPKLLMKLNFAGYCKVFSFDDFQSSKTITDKTLQFVQSMTRQHFVQVCIMAGCEYLPSIQQVGLKVAIKQFQKFPGGIEKVIEGMKTNKTFKERIPENYVEALRKVEQLFFYQTVYDPREQKLTSLENVPEDLETDLEFLGTFIDEDKLDEFINGYLSKSSMNKRETYGQVIDFKRLLEDYRQNNVTERSFVCLDRSFFRSGFQQSHRVEDQKEKRGSEEEKKESNVYHPRKNVEEEDLGFCNDEDDSDDDVPEKSDQNRDEQESKMPQINLDNQHIKEDLEILSSLCSDIITKHEIQQQSQQQLILASQLSVNSTPKSNKNRFLKDTSSSQNKNESKDKNTNPFKRFDDLKAIPEDPEKENKQKYKNISEMFNSQSKTVNKSEKKTEQKENGKKASTAAVADPSNSKKRKRDEISNSQNKASNNTNKKNGKLDSFFEKSNNKKLKANDGTASKTRQSKS